MRFKYTKFKSIWRRHIGLGPILFGCCPGNSQCLMQDHPVLYHQVSPPSPLHIFLKIKTFSNHLVWTCTLIYRLQVMYLDPYLKFPFPRWGWSFWTSVVFFFTVWPSLRKCMVNLGLTGKCTYFLRGQAKVLAPLICSVLVNTAHAGLTILNVTWSSHKVHVMMSHLNWLSPWWFWCRHRFLICVTSTVERVRHLYTCCSNHQDIPLIQHRWFLWPSTRPWIWAQFPHCSVLQSCFPMCQHPSRLFSSSDLSNPTSCASPLKEAQKMSWEIRVLVRQKSQKRVQVTEPRSGRKPVEPDSKAEFSPYA